MHNFTHPLVGAGASKEKVLESLGDSEKLASVRAGQLGQPKIPCHLPSQPITAFIRLSASPDAGLPAVRDLNSDSNSAGYPALMDMQKRRLIQKRTSPVSQDLEICHGHFLEVSVSRRLKSNTGVPKDTHEAEVLLLCLDLDYVIIWTY
ncbi:unnamed protein product [Protopolystoma xenopodis]|uniref:Uncharacterized protein n=1 Tax=Protopolystoma xenopodis TaxID=117903 RepID=A0A448XEI8_9PLAT|nr:unnamed protein product [Protopolystoma xenopodis]